MNQNKKEQCPFDHRELPNCDVCGKLGCKHLETQQGWEKEFRCRFWEEYTSNDRANLSWESLKSFIRQLLQQAKREAIKEYLKTEEGKVYQDYETLKKIARDEILEDIKKTLLENGHGGGNWRRIINQL